MVTKKKEINGLNCAQGIDIHLHMNSNMLTWYITETEFISKVNEKKIHMVIIDLGLPEYFLSSSLQKGAPRRTNFVAVKLIKGEEEQNR